LAFYDALLTRQFTGEETDLKGLVKLVYLSQKHSIDKQIKGYEDKTKRPLLHPTQDPTQGGTQGPSVQEKEKEKEEYTIDFEALLQYVNNAFGRNFRVVNNDVKAKYKRLFKNGYEKSDILKAINNCKEDKWHKENNYQYCTLEYFSRPATIDKYSDTTETNTKGIMSHPVIID
jgi:hypothetical protein